MFDPGRRCAPHPRGRRCALCGEPSYAGSAPESTPSYAPGASEGRPCYAGSAPEGMPCDAVLCEECVLGLRREDAGASPAFQRIGDGTERVIRLLRGEE